MAIQFFTDKIKIGDFTLYEGNGGLQFDGVARAERFQRTPSHQGFNTGYVAGGRSSEPGFPSSEIKSIEKFPFATDSTSTSVGNRVIGTISSAGNNSETHGYTSGGYGSAPGAPPLNVQNTIDKYPFSTDTNATDIGDMISIRSGVVGVSSYEHGYICAGTELPPGAPLNTIERFPFIADTNSTDHADLADTSHNESAPAASPTHGYVAGGGPGGSQAVSKFPFANNSNAVNNGNLISGKRQIGGGCSSSTHGYIAGGENTTPALVNSIEKWSFASNGASTDVGDLTASLRVSSKQSSLTQGYNLGGINPGSTYVNTIQKFPFATDSNAVAQTNNLSVNRGFGIDGPNSQ